MRIFIQMSSEISNNVERVCMLAHRNVQVWTNRYSTGMIWTNLAVPLKYKQLHSEPSAGFEDISLPTLIRGRCSNLGLDLPKACLSSMGLDESL